MNVARTNTKLGGRSFAAALLASALAYFLAGCSPALFLELRNETNVTVFAQDFKKGNLAIPSGEGRFLDLPGNQLTLSMPEKRVFDLRNPPSKHVHTTRRGLVLFAVLGQDANLYLARKNKEGKFERLEPQPDGFPLTGLAEPK